MKRFAVVGNPIAHSRSPEIHQQFAAQLQLEIQYDRLLAPPDGFAETVEDFFAQGGAGLNVTVPFKSQAADWVTEMDADASAAGAVNTIVRRDHAYRGYNTDGPGLIADIRANLGWPMADRRILVLGAGGAAAGVLGPLLAEQPASLTLANRTLANARALAARFPEIEVRAYQTLHDPFDLVINATSVGLGQHGTPADSEFAALLAPRVLDGAACYDMLYGPSAEFGRYALQCRAASVSDGLGMLVEQAALAFTLWLGQRPDTAPVINTLRAQLDTSDARQQD